MPIKGVIGLGSTDASTKSGVVLGSMGTLAKSGVVLGTVTLGIKPLANAKETSMLTDVGAIGIAPSARPMRAININFITTMPNINHSKYPKSGQTSTEKSPFFIPFSNDLIGHHFRGSLCVIIYK